MQLRALVVVLLATSTYARAECFEPVDSMHPWVSPGVTIGLGDDNHHALGLFAGGELSAALVFVHDECTHGGSPAVSIDWPTYRWLGLYADGVVYTSDGSSRFTIGPEIGWNLIGLDGGLVIRSDGTATWALRGVLTFGYVQLYLRGEDPKTGEAGVLFKWPVELHHVGRRQHAVKRALLDRANRLARNATTPLT